MKKKDLSRLSVGNYKLTDNIDNYKYDLIVGKEESGGKYYLISESGWPSRDSIYLCECIEDDEEYNYYPYKNLSAMCGVGGIRIHSNDTYSLLRELEMLPRGSFKIFVERTNNKQ